IGGQVWSDPMWGRAPGPAPSPWLGCRTGGPTRARAPAPPSDCHCITRASIIGEPQVYDALSQIADAELRIVVVHHPFDWLSEFDRNRTEARLGRDCHFILCGHVHNPQGHVMRGTAGDCVIIPAGASYERRIAKDPRYTNACNWAHLDF